MDRLRHELAGRYAMRPSPSPLDVRAKGRGAAHRRHGVIVSVTPALVEAVSVAVCA